MYAGLGASGAWKVARPARIDEELAVGRVGVGAGRRAREIDGCIANRCSTCWYRKGPWVVSRDEGRGVRAVSSTSQGRRLLGMLAVSGPAVTCRVCRRGGTLAG